MSVVATGAALDGPAAAPDLHPGVDRVLQLRCCRICLYWIRGGGCAAADVASCRIARLPAGPALLAARGLVAVLARAVSMGGG
jgi:hypothetical protein